MFGFGLLLVYSFSPVLLQIVFLPDRPLSIKSRLPRASAKEKHKEIFSEACVLEFAKALVHSLTNSGQEEGKQSSELPRMKRIFWNLPLATQPPPPQQPNAAPDGADSSALYSSCQGWKGGSYNRLWCGLDRYPTQPGLLHLYYSTPKAVAALPSPLFRRGPKLSRLKN